MSKLRKVLITVFLACLTVCVAFAVAACGKNMSPNFRNPGGIIDDGGDYKGKYVISVKSIGGLKLPNVTVTAKKNGEEIVTGISSEEGKIEFGIEAGEYELVVDETKLPNGYFVPSGTTFKTSADKENAEVIISSKVISSTMTSGTKYALGDIMYNFSFMNSYGMQFTLEELLQSKKAVALNFWYTTCPACVSEFPALNNAYKAYSDTIAVVALDSSDTPDQIAEFQNKNNYAFHFAKDNAGITSAFGVMSFPTTVIVDRYGVIAETHSGGIPQESTWKAIFNKYSSDDYTQDDPSQSGGDTETPAERTPFDSSIEMPATSTFVANVLGEGTEGKFDNFRPETNKNDAPYSWPWIIGEGGNYMTASNSKKPFSYGIIYTDVKMESGDVLSYEYKVDTEAEHDYLYALVNGKIVGSHSGNSATITGNKDGWVKEYGVYVADHTSTVTLSFIYIKDELLDAGTDTASVRNITITKISDSDVAIDQRVAVTDGKTLNNGSYGVKLKLNNEDGYYYYVDEDGGEYLLLANILENTPWSEQHFGADSFIPEAGSNAAYKASLYQISFWYMSNYKDDKKESLLFNYLTKDASKTLINNYNLQQFSKNELTPVTEALKDIIVKFTQAYCLENKKAYYEDQWLELCYYFRHYGLQHDLTGKTDEKDLCYRYLDPIKGLNRSNAIALGMPTGKLEMRVNKIDIIKHEYGSGIWYKLEIPSTGIYLFTTVAQDEKTDPRLALYDLNMNVIFDEYVDLRYDKFSRNVYEMSNVYKYQALQGNTTYYLQCDTRVPTDEGTYNLKIERLNTSSVNMLKVASTGEGFWTYTEDGFEYYLAVSTVLGPDGVYYHKDGNKIGSKIYIDFVHGNYFDQKNHSLEWLINNKNEGGEYYFKENRARMQQFLKESKQGKRVSDEDYGLLEATEELVNLLASFIQNFSSDFASDGLNSGAWKMFACYYEYYNV